jgi:hypothetical protein
MSRKSIEVQGSYLTQGAVAEPFDVTGGGD